MKRSTGFSATVLVALLVGSNCTMSAEWKMKMLASNRAAVLQTLTESGNVVFIECSSAGLTIGAMLSRGTTRSEASSRSTIALDGKELNAENIYTLGIPPFANSFQFSAPVRMLEELTKGEQIAVQVGSTTVNAQIDPKKIVEFSQQCRNQGLAK